MSHFFLILVDKRSEHCILIWQVILRFYPHEETKDQFIKRMRFYKPCLNICIINASLKSLREVHKLQGKKYVKET